MNNPPGFCRRLCACALLTTLAGCAGPSVNLNTPEPLQVDINMRVDIYQHAGSGKKPGGGASADARQNATSSTPESRRRNRMADIQEFKNSRLIGEGREGLLVILEPPPGEYGQFVTRTVAEENADRMQIMKATAEQTKRPLPAVQAEQAAEWRKRAFRGEWIEVPGQDSDAFRWTQKEG